MFVKTSELTRGEKLRILRRRSGETQQAAAKRLKVSLNFYRQWELDEVTEKVPSVSLGRLLDYEQCFILRRRGGKTLANVAETIGVCKGWLMQMESGEAPIQRLKAYWTVRI